MKMLSLAWMLADGAAATGTGTGTGNNKMSIVFIVVLGVAIVAMVLLTILPNKRRQKDYQRMQDELREGTRIMTIGRMVGTVKKVNADGKTLEVDVGTPEQPVVITISREAVGINLDAQEAAQQAREVKHVDVDAPQTPKNEKVDGTESLGEEKSEMPEEKPAVTDDDAI